VVRALTCDPIHEHQSYARYDGRLSKEAFGIPVVTEMLVVGHRMSSSLPVSARRRNVELKRRTHSTSWWRGAGSCRVPARFG
jgi:hypothetical protein